MAYFTFLATLDRLLIIVDDFYGVSNNFRTILY
jgi:hypothetical protein